VTQTVDVDEKRRLRGTESVRRLARVTSRVARLNVSDPQSSVERPMTHPAVVDAVPVLPPLHQRRRTGNDRADEAQRGTDSGHVEALIVTGQTRRCCDTYIRVHLNTFYSVQSNE